MFLRPWNGFGADRAWAEGARSRMERLFGNLETLLGTAMPALPAFAGPAAAGNTDLWEDADGLTVTAELPGVTAADVEVSVEGAEVSIKARRPAPELPKEAIRHRHERPFGEFVRTITLPTLVDGTKATADFRDGVLTLRLPKPEAARPRKIEVKAV